MIIPVISTLRAEDFPQQKGWISKLFFPINQFLLAVTSAINGNLTFGDNIPCQTIKMSFVYSASTDFPKTVKWSLPTSNAQATASTIQADPVELRVCSATENGVAIPIVIAWSFSNATITIASITKLQTSAVASGTTPALQPLVAGATYNIVLRGQP